MGAKPTDKQEVYVYTSLPILVPPHGLCKVSATRSSLLEARNKARNYNVLSMLTVYITVSVVPVYPPPPILIGLNQLQYCSAKMHFGQSKRGRNDGMEISLETDVLIPDCLKRIRLDSPVDRTESRQQSDEWEDNNKERKTGHTKSPNFELQYTPNHPLRRPRSQLDESIDNIIRKSRRLCEASLSAPQYVDMQIVPLGPDPLQDRRILGTLIDNDTIEKAQKARSDLWQAEGRHPNVYNYVSNDEYKALVAREEHGGGMDTGSSADNRAHYANDITHADWVLSMDAMRDSESGTPTAGRSSCHEGSVPMES